jgi:hypothetical protein
MDTLGNASILPRPIEGSHRSPTLLFGLRPILLRASIELSFLFASRLEQVAALAAHHRRLPLRPARGHGYRWPHEAGVYTGKILKGSQIPDTARWIEWPAIVCSIVVAGLFCSPILKCRRNLRVLPAGERRLAPDAETTALAFSQ